MLDLGSSEQDIVKQAIRSGQQVPDRIANAPELNLGLLFYLQAFFDLDAERSQGFSRGRIPWSRIAEYAKYYELDNDQTDCLLCFIRAMDTAHLKRLEEENKNG